VSYNTWYSDTYEEILDIAEWSVFENNIERKMVSVFSWMPTVIMGIKHSKDERKYDLYALKDMTKATQECKKFFEEIKTERLLDVDLVKIEENIINIVERLYPILGTVAASKYLHFSAPCLFPMWDSKIRGSRNLADSPEGYYKYMNEIKKELKDKKNYSQALSKYGANPIRGWDIVLMENR
jgi:hypothetical protein